MLNETYLKSSFLVTSLTKVEWEPTYQDTYEYHFKLKQMLCTSTMIYQEDSMAYLAQSCIHTCNLFSLAWNQTSHHTKDTSQKSQMDSQQQQQGNSQSKILSLLSIPFLICGSLVNSLVVINGSFLLINIFVEYLCYSFSDSS